MERGKNIHTCDLRLQIIILNHFISMRLFRALLCLPVCFFFAFFPSGQDMTTFLLSFPFIFFEICCFFAKSLHKAYKKNAFFLSQGAFCCQPFFSSPPFSSHQTRSSLRLAGIQDLSPPPPPRLFQSQFLGNPGLTVTEQLSGGRGRGGADTPPQLFVGKEQQAAGAV